MQLLNEIKVDFIATITGVTIDDFVGFSSHLPDAFFASFTISFIISPTRFAFSQ